MNLPAPRPAPGNSVYLYPGQIIVTSEPVVITTILGSCVAVCLRDPRSGVAGINHFLLPKNPGRGAHDARYGDTAMEALIAAFWKRGAPLDRLVAKIFGGACVLAGFANTAESIGAQNVRVARHFLQQRPIDIAADQTGGDRGRKLLFDVRDGGTWVREI